MTDPRSLVHQAEREARRQADKARYHPADPKDYGSPVGMPIEDDKGNVVGYACVGCWFCCPDEEGTV